MLKIETELGKLNIDKNVIGRIVSEAVFQCKEDVYLSNHKGKPLKLQGNSGMHDHSHEMEIYVEEGVLNIEFYLILRFGISIKDTTGKILDNISSDLNAILGMERAKMKITVTGMFVKDLKNIVKRNIEVRR